MNLVLQDLLGAVGAVWAAAVAVPPQVHNGAGGVVVVGGGFLGAEDWGAVHV